MHPDLRGISENMLDLGLGAMMHALRLSFYYNHDNASWAHLSVLNAAHAAEILIKARIAQEHPLLIFSDIPKSTKTSSSKLSFLDLFESGRTLDFQDLPERLWATTGVHLPGRAAYLKFGRLRNAIQHFAPSTEDASQRTLEFIFGVVDPFVFEQWGLYAIDYNEEFGDHYEHIFETIVSRGLRPRISPTAAKAWRHLGYEPGPEAPPECRAWFAAGMRDALGGG